MLPCMYRVWKRVNWLNPLGWNLKTAPYERTIQTLSPNEPIIKESWLTNKLSYSSTQSHTCSYPFWPISSIKQKVLYASLLNKFLLLCFSHFTCVHDFMNPANTTLQIRTKAPQSKWFESIPSIAMDIPIFALFGGGGGRRRCSQVTTYEYLDSTT